MLVCSTLFFSIFRETAGRPAEKATAATAAPGCRTASPQRLGIIDEPASITSNLSPLGIKTSTGLHGIKERETLPSLLMLCRSRGS